MDLNEYIQCWFQLDPVIYLGGISGGTWRPGSTEINVHGSYRPSIYSGSNSKRARCFFFFFCGVNFLFLFLSHMGSDQDLHLAMVQELLLVVL